ncbi:MAG: ABC-type sugar transport system periplasmic component-like protein [Subtercola sp.]|nr:ABC-type sugar transport system periplasmic component-like protein [Subtercola sp.]
MLHTKTLAIVALAAGVAIITGCSSGTPQTSATGTTSATDVSYAQSRVAQYSAAPDTKPAGPAFDASAAKGKTVWYIPLVATVAPIQAISKNLERALGVAGVQVQQCDGKGTAVGWNSCIQQAVAQKPDAIILESITPDLVSASVQQAKDAGIPVLIDTASDSTSPWQPAAAAQVSYDYTLGSQLVADWIIADSAGKANVLVIDTDDLSLKQAVTVDGYQAEFAAHCAGCSVTVDSVTSSADWGTKVTPLVVAALTKDPTIDYVVAEYDPQVPGVTAALAQLDKKDSVKVAAFNASLEQMQDLDAKNYVSVEVGSDQNSLGWAEADQVLRVMTGQAPVQREATGTRVFTSDTISSVDLTTDSFYSGQWYGNGFEADYRALWGLN